MKKNDSLKKHHFWILLGLVPLCVLIAVLMVTSSVGGAIEAKMAEIDAAQKSLSGKQPKSEKLLGVLDIRIEEVKKKKKSLWEQNWDLQKTMYKWPTKSQQLQAVEKLDLKFGAPIPDDNFTRDQFTLPAVYLHEYSDEDRAARKPATRGMAHTIAPTEFRGGWERVLRHVTRTGWGPAAPTSEQIWLLMEDLWVQRSLLDAVRSVNASFSEFTRVKFVRDNVTIDDPAKGAVENKRSRRFESRTWAVELEAKEKEGERVLTGRLINLTNRLQLMGMNNTMTLKVWLTKGKEVRPFEFKIGGEFLPGVGALKPDGKTPANVLDIVFDKDHIIPASIAASLDAIEIDRVEQVLDTRTVPVRRIEGLALGFTDSRHAGSQLVPPEFLKPKEGDPSAAPTMGMMGDVGGGLPPPLPGGMGGIFPGGMPGMGTDPAANRLSGGGTLETVVDANKNRYIQVTRQVRRMPVAIAVVVDQSHMQDVLLAFANSPTLRFQITQVTWKRFRDRLEGGGAGGGTGSTGDPDIEFSGPGNVGMLGAPTPGRFPVGPPGMGTEFQPMMPPGSPLGPPGPPGMVGDPMNPYSSGMGGGLTTVSESQLTSGLVELTVYGIVSLYEKYSPEEEAADAEKEAKEKEAKEKEAKEKAAKDQEAKDMTPKDADPKKGTNPMPKEPVIPDPKSTKMRRRVRKS